MLSTEEKTFFLRIAMGARDFSNSNIKRGAILIRGRQILSYGFSKRIIKNKEWEMSAAYDAIFGARIEDLKKTLIFLTYFSTVDDLKLIVATGISAIYFHGKIEDTESVKFMNDITKASIPLEIVQLG